MMILVLVPVLTKVLCEIHLAKILLVRLAVEQCMSVLLVVLAKHCRKRGRIGGRRSIRRGCVV